MKVWGLTKSKLNQVARTLGISFSGTMKMGYHWKFQAVPKDIEGRYVRYGFMEYERKDGTKYRKRIHSLCYHGFRDLIRALFDAGAVKVETSWGKWSSKEEFETDLPRLSKMSEGRTDACTCSVWGEKGEG